MSETGEEEELVWKEESELCWPEESDWTELMLDDFCDCCPNEMRPLLWRHGGNKKTEKKKKLVQHDEMIIFALF